MCFASVTDALKGLDAVMNSAGVIVLLPAFCKRRASSTGGVYASNCSSLAQRKMVCMCLVNFRC